MVLDPNNEPEYHLPRSQFFKRMMPSSRLALVSQQVRIRRPNCAARVTADS